MSKFYQISTADFADKHGDYELIGVEEQSVFVESADTLGEPFVELAALPEHLQAELDEKLKNAKTNKIQAINDKRDETINAGVEYKGHIFQSADEDRNLLVAAGVNFQKLGGTPENFVWISKDNEQVPFSLDDLFFLGAKMAQSVNENTLKARTLKDKVLAAATLKEIEAIKWD